MRLLLTILFVLPSLLITSYADDTAVDKMVLERSDVVVESTTCSTSKVVYMERITLKDIVIYEAALSEDDHWVVSVAGSTHITLNMIYKGSGRLPDAIELIGTDGLYFEGLERDRDGALAFIDRKILELLRNEVK